MLWCHVSDVWCVVCVVWCVVVVGVVVCGCWLLLVVVVVWRPGPPSGGPPKIYRFFPLLPQFSFFLLSLGGLLVEFWWCF